MVTITLMGAIGIDWGEKIVKIDSHELKSNLRLKQILEDLKQIKKEKFLIYFDNDFTPKRGTIIIINGIDYKVLDGLNTNISNSDTITFIPTISGG